MASGLNKANPRGPELRDQIVYEEYWKSNDYYAPSATVVEMFELMQLQFRSPYLADLGCGVGRHALAARERGLRVTAIDYHQGAIARLREHPRSGGIEIVCDNLLSWLEVPSRVGMFDGAVCFDVIHHLGSSEDEIRYAMGVVRKAVRPGGYIVLTLLTDIDYGAGDVPRGRFLVQAGIGHELLLDIFRADNIIRSKVTEVHFSNTANFDAQRGGLIRSTYRATRLILFCQISEAHATGRHGK